MKSWWWGLKKHNYLVVKLGCLFLLVALFYRVLFSRSIELAVISDTSFNDSVTPVSVAVIPQHHIEEPLIAKGNIENESKCDLVNGDWIPDPAGPVYTNETCKWIADHQNCLMNGRPDTDYLYWRWKPHSCDLAQLNPERFLEMMRNKAWAFIGDSITRNHVQSLICLLSKVEVAVEVYHDEEYRCRKWLFRTYNVTVSVIWSPFLAEAAIFEDINGVSTSDIEIHLDRLDSKWTQEFETFDYMMFSSGKWYVKTAIYYENNTILGCHNCPKRNLTELGFDIAYGRVLKTVFEFITGSDHYGKKIFFRTSTPDHFEHGGWSEGGNCNRTKPFKEGEFELSELVRILRNVELEEFKKVSSNEKDLKINLELFDVTSLSLLRPDGHPGPYRYFQPFDKIKSAKIINDCLHWCLPGPIDAWSDVLMEMVVRSH